MKIKTVKLTESGLTTSQATAIFEAILTEEELDLENISFRENKLGEVESDLLARAVVKIKTVDLNDTELTACQATAIFHAILEEEELDLKNLNIGDNYLDEVDDSELMAGAVVRLKTVDLNYGELTTSQAGNENFADPRPQKMWFNSFILITQKLGTNA